uniref:Uncharacterized protein n=1 Tax=Ditylenchus dipsaci TaxID=166011 RepID=A0A915D9Y1_9BILA
MLVALTLLFFLSCTFVKLSYEQALPASCGPIANQVPFYLDPSVNTAGNAQVVNAPVSTCATCSPNVVYFQSATTQSLYNGNNIPDTSYIFMQGTIAGIPNGIAQILLCANACVCDANGRCATISSPMTNFALYPICSAGTCAMTFYVVSTQPASPTGGPPPGTIAYNDGTTQMFTSYQMNTNPYTNSPMAGTIPITTASCNGCTIPITCTTTTTAIISTVTAPTATTPTPSLQPNTNPALCFSADTFVRTSEGEIKRMDQINLGDWVMAANGSDVIFSPIESWIHRVPDRIAEFIGLELENGIVVKLTAKHFIYITKCTNKLSTNRSLSYFEEFHSKMLKTAPVYAEKVRPGDCLLQLASLENKLVLVERVVVNVNRVEQKGIYSPMTGQGTIFVEDILASCFTILDSSVLQRNFVKNFPKKTDLQLPGIETNAQRNKFRVDLSSVKIYSLLYILEYVLPFNGVCELRKSISTTDLKVKYLSECYLSVNWWLLVLGAVLPAILVVIVCPTILFLICRSHRIFGQTYKIPNDDVGQQSTRKSKPNRSSHLNFTDSEFEEYVRNNQDKWSCSIAGSGENTNFGWAQVDDN